MRHFSAHYPLYCNCPGFQKPHYLNLRLQIAVIVVADIKDSTSAVASGKDKEVNMAAYGSNGGFWCATQVYITNSGKRISVAETHPIGHSLSDIRISSKGFEQEFNRTFRNIDPIKEVLIAGLDHDGFDELYIVTVSAGLGSYGSVIGIASIRDERLSMIYFPQIELDDPVFEGWTQTWSPPGESAR